jgi:hypothetical protein
MTDDDFLGPVTYVYFHFALDDYGVGVVATIIEKYGITAEDRFGRQGHRAPDSVEAAALLDFCERRREYLDRYSFHHEGEDLPLDTWGWGDLKHSQVSGAGWPYPEFEEMLAAAKQARVDAVGQAAAQKEVDAVNVRRQEDQSKLDATNAVLLGAVLALLRGEVKDARNDKTITYESEAQIQRVLVALRDAGNNFRGLSQATIERRFADAKGYFPLKGSHTVALGG